MSKRKTGLYDNKGIQIQEGNRIRVKLKDGVYHTFDVIWCNGAFKIMETKSMFEGAVDGWLHELLTICRCREEKPRLLNVRILNTQ